MPIPVVCSWCDRKFAAPDSAAGKTTSCPGCKGVVTVPASAAPRGGTIGPPPGFDDDPQPASSGGSGSPAFDAEGYSLEPPEPAAAAQAGGEQRRPCPVCGEWIINTAVKCRFCGEVFDATLRGSSLRSAKPGQFGKDDDMTGFDWFLALLCPGIGCIVGIVRLIQGQKSAGKMLVISIAMTVFWNVVLAVLKQLGEGR
jgi:hypothetical protein